MRRKPKGRGLRKLRCFNFFVSNVQTGLDCDRWDYTASDVGASRDGT